MSYENEILEQSAKKEDIIKIFNLVNSNKIIKTQHFYDRIFLRDVPEELVDQTLPLIDKVRLIDKRQHKRDIGYGT